MNSPAGLPGPVCYDRNAEESEELDTCSNAGCHRLVGPASSFCSDECRDAALGEVYDTVAIAVNGGRR